MSSPKTLLILEDDDTMRALLKENCSEGLTSPEGLPVRLLTCGSLAEIPDDLSDVDVFLLDFNLGGSVTSEDFIIRTREGYPNAKIILLSAVAAPSALSRSVSPSGYDASPVFNYIDAMLAKPVPWDSLRSVLRGALYG